MWVIEDEEVGWNMRCYRGLIMLIGYRRQEMHTEF
jgi:hypothetical protein